MVNLFLSIYLNVLESQDLIQGRQNESKIVHYSLLLAKKSAYKELGQFIIEVEILRILVMLRPS